MTPEQGFSLASTGALAAWLALAASLALPAGRWQARLAWLGGRLAPALLCAFYAWLLVRWWGSAPGGGFGSLDAVGRLFAVPGKLLGGWVHYLAFDLLVGRWMLDDGRARRLPRWALLPLLVATLLYGPLGWLLYLGLRTAWRRAGGAPSA